MALEALKVFRSSYLMSTEFAQSQRWMWLAGSLSYQHRRLLMRLQSWLRLVTVEWLPCRWC